MSIPVVHIIDYLATIIQMWQIMSLRVIMTLIPLFRSDLLLPPVLPDSPFITFKMTPFPLVLLRMRRDSISMPLRDVGIGIVRVSAAPAVIITMRATPFRSPPLCRKIRPPSAATVLVPTSIRVISIRAA